MVPCMEVVFHSHPARRREARGATVEEIESVVLDAIANGTATPDPLPGRERAERVFPFNAIRDGKFYPRKLVRVVFVHEPARDRVYIVTVVTKFGEYAE